MTAREILTAQIAQLRAAIDAGTDPFALSMARRYLTRARIALQDIERAPLSDRSMLGQVGPNGWGPGVDDVVRQLMRPAPIGFTTERLPDGRHLVHMGEAA